MTIVAILAAVIGFLLAVLRNQFVTSKDSKQVADLKNQAAQADGDAAEKVKEYEDALKLIDPDFHSDNGDGTKH